MNKDFISQILQYLGYISAFGIAFTQYFLRDSIALFFSEDPHLFSASSLVAFLLSIVIILAVFSSRYSISFSKIHFNRSKYQKYLAQFRNQQSEIQGQQTTSISEPIGFTVKQLALFLAFLSLADYGFFIAINDQLYAKSILYILLIILIIASITIYATSLYVENDYSQREKAKKDLMQSKLREYFAGDIRIQQSWRDDSNLTRPFQRMTVQRESKKYSVTIDANDPEKFFTVDEIQPKHQ